MKDNKPIEIVLTGGPSSGKTASLAYIQEKLTEWGYLVLVMPEIATQVFSSGIPNPETLSVKQRDAYVGVEKAIVYIQSDMREQYLEMAKLFGKKKTVVLYDRAEMDASAYLSDEEWQYCLEEREVNSKKMRDSYDAVIHLRSVALARDLEYNQEQNPQRRENKEMAIEADHRTLASWMGHPNLHIIDPNQDFESKKRDVLAALATILGRKKSFVLGEERRFMFKGNLARVLPRSYQHYRITQIFLKGSSLDQWHVLTKRETLGEKSSTVTYYRGDSTEDPLGHANDKMVRGRIISRDEYERMLRSDAPKKRNPIVKDRYTFRVDRDVEVELDFYENGLSLVTTNSSKPKKDLPAWFGKEVTKDDSYSTIALGLANKR